ncbi:MAG TPA: ATP-binding protein [Candidatus Limnocylindrales bacterium]|nr:ATP-binding protein [Candidatus Limnocylindrales bacterium]
MKSKLALIPVIILLAIALVTVGFNASRSIVFNPPNFLFFLSLIFWTTASSIAVYASLKGYIGDGSRTVLFLTTSLLIFGAASTIAGRVQSFSANFSWTIGNIGSLVASIVQLTASLAVLLQKDESRSKSRKRIMLASFVGSLVFVGLLSLIALQGWLPAFYSHGPTVFRQWIVATAGVFFGAAFIIYGTQYFSSKRSSSLLYSLAISLLTLGLFCSLMVTKPGDLISWVARISLYTGAIFVILAFYETRKLGDSVVGWAETFRSDRQQVAALFTNMSNGLFYGKVVIDSNGKPTDWINLDFNKSFEQITGFAGKKIIGKRATETFANYLDLPDLIEKYGQVAITGEPAHFERYRQPTAKWLDISTYSPKRGYFVAVVEDITERKKAEEALARAKEQSELGRNHLEAVLETMPSAVVIVEASGKFSYLNKCALSLYGIDYVGFDLDAHIAKVKPLKPDGTPFPLEEMPVSSSLKLGQEIHGVEMTILSATGARWPVLISSAPLKNNEGKIISAVVIFEDITERKKAEEELKRQLAVRNARNRMLHEAISSKSFEALGEVCLEVAEELTGSQFGFIGEVNENGLEDIAISNPGWDACVMYDQSGHRRPPGNFKLHGIYGRVLIDGRGFFTNNPTDHPDRIGLPKGHPPLNNFIGVPLKTNDKTTGIIALANREGGYSQTELDSLENLAPIIVEAFSRKRAEEKLAEYSKDLEKVVEERTKQLKSAERLSAIGATAGMVGHDIRNPLQAITGDVFLAKSELAGLPDSEEKRNILESLEETERNIDYINKIVADLQDYARPLNPKAQESNLKSTVEGVILKTSIPNNVTIRVKAENEAQTVMADPDFLKRIISNLVLNAVQAMPQGGKLTVKTFKDKASGDVLLTVEDTGVGIPDEVKDKLFTPMFTTKSKGQGFGLAVVKRMAEALGGIVTFESEPGNGTKFIVRLPPQRNKR